uniref:CUB domain-containing protein n=1 Tax=Romanomermis culicivorax TaxID=13658 RepID=A0A915L139_ROMCU
KCSVKLHCLHGGYTDPRRCDRCRCPDGFTGKLCDKIMGGYGATCGGEIPMNNLYYYFNSPNYPQNFDEGQECSWLLRVRWRRDFCLMAPVGQFVQLEFVGSTFELYCKMEHSLCMDYVEIRNASDFANTGM